MNSISTIRTNRNGETQLLVELREITLADFLQFGKAKFQSLTDSDAEAMSLGGRIAQALRLCHEEELNPMGFCSQPDGKKLIRNETSSKTREVNKATTAAVALLTNTYVRRYRIHSPCKRQRNSQCAPF